MRGGGGLNQTRGYHHHQQQQHSSRSNGGVNSRYHSNAGAGASNSFGARQRGHHQSYWNSSRGRCLQQLVGPDSLYRFHDNGAQRPTQRAPQPAAPSELAATAYADVNACRIWQLFVEKRQTDATYERKLMLRDALLSIVSSAFQSAGLFIVGSSMNGFGTDQTDLDLCLMLTSEDLHQKREAAPVLNAMLKPLRQCRFLYNVTLIRAKVPIIKFRDSISQLECDLNVNNKIGIYNTHLMAAYAKCDWRVRPLVMFVKLWAQSLRVQDASQGRLSSYSLALMTVQYLQAGCNPPVLYSLQALYPQLFDYGRPYADIDMRVQLPWEELRSQNGQNLGQLFCGFVQFYSEFDWRSYSVSVRLGKPLPIQLAFRLVSAEEQRAASGYKVYVEEPFSLTNAARSVYSDEVFAQIQRAFKRTAQALRSQRSLSEILGNPV